MSITLGQILIFQTGLRKEKSIYCGMSFNSLAWFFESASLMKRVILQSVNAGI